MYRFALHSVDSGLMSSFYEWQSIEGAEDSIQLPWFDSMKIYSFGQSVFLLLAWDSCQRGVVDFLISVFVSRRQQQVQSSIDHPQLHDWGLIFETKRGFVGSLDDVVCTPQQSSLLAYLAQLPSCCQCQYHPVGQQP
jgi:hypothetical protein